MTHIPETVRALDRELREIFGDRLYSVVAYGLQAIEASNLHGPDDHHQHGDPQQRALMTLAVVDAITPDDLHACAAHVAAWHDAGLATPLLLARHEFERSLDAFPFEFGAILADHDVVSGPNPFNGLNVNPADIRRACELQARSHLLHLREGYLEARGRGDALAVLIVRSAAPLAALLEHVARLQGRATHDVAAAARYAERALALSDNIITDIVKLVTVSEISSAEATQLFPPYLDAVERLTKYLDAWRTA